MDYGPEHSERCHGICERYDDSHGRNNDGPAWEPLFRTNEFNISISTKPVQKPMDFPRDTRSIRYNGNDHIRTVLSAVIRHSPTTSVGLILPSSASSSGSSARGAKKNADTQTIACAPDQSLNSQNRAP